MGPPLIYGELVISNVTCLSGKIYEMDPLYGQLVKNSTVEKVNEAMANLIEYYDAHMGWRRMLMGRSEDVQKLIDAPDKFACLIERAKRKPYIHAMPYKEPLKEANLTDLVYLSLGTIYHNTGNREMRRKIKKHNAFFDINRTWQIGATGNDPPKFRESTSPFPEKR